MITIQIDENELLDQLVDRVRYWTDDEDVITLYEQMYENYVYGGCFDNSKIDIMQIVDNDYINWCNVITEGDDCYEGINELYDENGLGDISCECDKNGGYSFIEAYYNGMYLVRS